MRRCTPEHKSQGLFQTKCLQDRFENFWIFGTIVPSAVDKTAAFFREVRPEGALEEKNGAESSEGRSQN